MKHTYQIGLLAESLCLLRLWCSGWRIVARRFKHPCGEIDLIAQRGQQIAFIEVKSRHSRETALQSVSHRQQQRIIQAAHGWLNHAPEYAGFSFQFDIMWVTKWPWPGRLCNAWPAQ